MLMYSTILQAEESLKVWTPPWLQPETHQQVYPSYSARGFRQPLNKQNNPWGTPQPLAPISDSGLAQNRIKQPESMQTPIPVVQPIAPTKTQTMPLEIKTSAIEDDPTLVNNIADKQQTPVVKAETVAQLLATKEKTRPKALPTTSQAKTELGIGPSDVPKPLAIITKKSSMIEPDTSTSIPTPIPKTPAVSVIPCKPTTIIEYVQLGEDTSDTSHLLDQAAEDHQIAEIAMQQGDYAIAYSLWLPLAESGDADAQFSLGWMHHNGYGLSINNTKTVKYWRAAARQGKHEALFSLGILYSQGDKKVKRDLNKSVNYYLKAIAQGNEEAKDMLSYLIAQNTKKIRLITQDWGKSEWKIIGVHIPIVVNRANARKAPSTQSKILFVLNKTDHILGLYRQGSWVKAYSEERDSLFWLYDALLDQDILTEML